MSVGASANRADVTYVAQTDFDAFPATPTMQSLRTTGTDGIQLDRETTDAAEVRPDYEVGDLVQGFTKVSLSLPFNLSVGTYDDLLAGLLFNSWDAGVLVPGLTPKFFLMEDRQTDIGAFIQGKNMAVNSMSLKVEPGKAITGTFDFVGAGYGKSTVSVANSVTPQGTAPVIDTFAGNLKEGGTELGIVTSLDMNVTRGLAPGYAAFRDSAVQIVSSKIQITGTLGLYYKNLVYLSKFIDKTQTTLSLTLLDSTGAGYVIDLPKVFYTGGKLARKDPDRLLSLPFRALFDSVSGHSMKVTQITP